jgi:hypothetical protein
VHDDMTDMTATTEFDIILNLRCSNAIAPEALEEDMNLVLEAVEQHAPQAFGPAVSGRVDEQSISLAFTVVADSQAAVHRAVTDVVEAIEQHSGLSFGCSDTAVRAPERELTAVG